VRRMSCWADWWDGRHPGVISGVQLANEPALGPPGIFDAEINRFYERALLAARAHLPTTPLLMSFMHPLPTVIDFLRASTATSARLADGAVGAEVLADHHYYLNWQSPQDEPFSWEEIHRRACLLEAEQGAREVDEYRKHRQKIIVGEWSIATNHDAPRDLTDPATVRELTRLYREQLEMFGRKAPEVVGHFFWTLRMGSGWDPRPSDTHPFGRQREGTSSRRSQADFPFRSWSLLEMADIGIATPINRSYAGVCES